MAWKSRPLFFLLLILQIAFFSVLFFVSHIYLPKILENSKAIYDYVSQQKLDDVSVASDIIQQKNILGDDILSISRNFDEVVNNFRLYLTYLFILLIIFTSINWALANRLVHGFNFRRLSGNFLKNFVALFFYLGLIFYFFFSLLNISIADAAAESAKLFAKYLPFLVFSVVLFYFMLISLSLLHNTELKNIVQKTLRIGIKKIHYVLAACSINILLLILPIILLYYFNEGSLIISMFSAIFIIFSFVFVRIFMINVVRKLNLE